LVYREKDLTLIGTLDPAEINDRIDADLYSDGFNAEQTPDVVAALCDRFPSFEAGHMHSGYSGPFDVTPDWHPIIDESPGLRGFYLAVGFSGHGFKLSTTVGEMVAELVINGKRAESDINLTSTHSATAALPRISRCAACATKD
jgi:glycine/D-amino acid oxidase-like deaminating enzyme